MYLAQHFSNDDRANLAKFDRSGLRQKLRTVPTDDAVQTDPFPTVDEILDRVTQKTKSFCEF